jgi:capsular exopolysaccharide synthesis family protein
MEGETNQPSIGSILWRGKWLILASVVIMVVLAALYTSTEPKVYEASGIIEVNVPSNAAAANITATNQALATNYASLLTSAGFLSEVRPHVDGGRLSVAALQGKLSSSVVTNSALVQLQVKGPTPADARKVAEQVMTGFLTYLRISGQTQARQLQATLQGEISRLSTEIAAASSAPRSPASSSKLASLKAQLAELVTEDATLVSNGAAQATSATLAAPAVASATPVSPKKSLNLLGGLVLGLVIGIALAWARQILRPTIHSAQDVTSLVDAPLLGSIPLVAKPGPGNARLREAYGVLYTNLIFALRGDEMRVVTFVGYNQGAGKSSAVEGVARAAALSGRSVLVVDGDLRAGTLTQRLGAGGGPGLSDVLQNRIAVEEALVEVEEGVMLLPASPARGANPASLLAGSRTPRVMASLRNRFDLIVVDSPPLAGLADGLVLGAVSDAVVLVVRTDLTKPSEVNAAVRGLLQNSTTIAGVVIFEEQTDRLAAYYPPMPPAEPRSQPIVG